MPCMRPENYVVPDLTSLKPLSQAAFLFEAFKSSSLISPSYPNSQMFHHEGFAKQKSVDIDVSTIACSVEEVRVGNGIEGSNIFPRALESPAPFLKLETSGSGGQNHGANVEDLNACNGLHPKEMNLGSFASRQKRFILFDQTGHTSRVFFPPSQYPMKEMDAPNMDRKRVMRNSKEPIEDNYLGWKAGCHGNEETVMALAFAALQKTRASRWNSVSLGNFGDELIPESGEGEGESTSKVSNHVSRQERAPSSSSEMHEDIEGLEALLSSDSEESSTGHSPSDTTGKDEDNYVEDEFGDVTSGISMKRRRIDTRECAEDEINLISDPAKEPFEKLMINKKCLSPDISVVDTSSWEPGMPDYLENVGDNIYNDVLLRSHRSYSKSNECCSKIDGNEQFQTSKRFTRQSGLIKKSRNENIKRTVEHLRSIIPGGDGMGTADVLDETIQIVKALQQKVKRMEANQQDVI